MSLSILPRRRRPKHAGSAVPELVHEALPHASRRQTTPGIPAPAGAPEATGPQKPPGDVTVTFPAPIRSAMATGPADLDKLRRVRDGLKALDGKAPAATRPDLPPLPATVLLAFPRDGGEGSAKEILSGWPAISRGMRVTETGLRMGGLCLGFDGDVEVFVENPSVEYWDRLIIAAKHVRDMQAYGSFRAASAAPVAPAGGAR